MNALRRAVSEVGVEELLNCVLVREGVRPAFLLQPIDYGECRATDPMTSRKLAGIRRLFPELQHSVVREGIMIAKRAYTFEELDSGVAMGRALGLMCAEEFEYVESHPDEDALFLDIYVDLVPGGNVDGVQLLVNVCRNDATFGALTELARRMEVVLKVDPLVGRIVERVTARKRRRSAYGKNRRKTRKTRKTRRARKNRV